MDTQELIHMETRPSPGPACELSPAPVIDVTHLQKAYGPTIAVEDVSFAVNAGEIFGILGRNGAGKTTTVECVTGLRTPDRGSISVLGLDPRRHGRELHERVGVQLQHSALQDRIRVSEAVELYASFYRQPADGRELLGRLGLEASRDQYFGKLSGGQKQRLSIVLALIGRPEIAILDELTTGLDPEARRDSWKLIEGIRDQGVTIVLVTHLMEEAERLCDRVALIDRGRVVALGRPATLSTQASSSQRIRLRSPGSLGEAVLKGVPEVSRLERHGQDIVLSGSGDLLTSVVLAFDRAGLHAEDVRTETTNLEDAFLALTDENTDATTTNPEK